MISDGISIVVRHACGHFQSYPYGQELKDADGVLLANRPCPLCRQAWQEGYECGYADCLRLERERNSA